MADFMNNESNVSIFASENVSKVAAIEILAQQIEQQIDLENMVLPQHDDQTDASILRAGYSTEGDDYPDIKTMWKSELGLTSDNGAEVENPENGIDNWYKKGGEYWENEENCTADIAGVLGGFPELSEPDIRDNNMFIEEIKKLRPQMLFQNAADCGAGVGRLTRDFLLHRFAQVDLIEQSTRLSKASPGFVGEGADRCRFMCIGLQDYAPEAGSLDCIWTQWVVGHLTDVDFVAYLKRCKLGLRQGGVLVIKDNCCEDEVFVVDSDDSSITRCAAYMRSIFESAELTILIEKVQKGFPEDLFPVLMFCLV